MGTFSHSLAKHVRQIYFGGNWCESSLKQQLSDVSAKEANTAVGSMNTIGALAYHITYYIPHLANFLEGLPFKPKDSESWKTPNFESDLIWQAYLVTAWNEAERFAKLIESLDDDALHQPFVKETYGSYFNNFVGMVEHLHYHLGQIVVLKKIIRQQTNQP